MTPTPSTARRARRRTVVRLGAVVAATALLAGCELSDAREVYEDSLAFGFPDPVTDQGEAIYELWLGSTAAAAVVGLFVWALMLYAAIRFRKTSDALPRQVRYNLPIEVLYTFIPFVIISVLFYYTVVAQNTVNKVTAQAKGGPDHTVEVVGFQWNWTFKHHNGNLDTPVEAEVTGEPARRAELVLPANRTIRFVETSPDVIHSFFVPAFLFKRDVVPGVTNQFEITIRKEGRYIGRCAEYCGEKHSRMNFWVDVVSPEEYDRYLAEQRNGSAAGSGPNKTVPDPGGPQ